MDLDSMQKSKIKLLVCVTLVFLNFCINSTLKADNTETKKDEKIDFRILYVGHPESEREKEYVNFLRTHFKEVGKVDLQKFEKSQTKGFDVIIMDYDGRCFDAPLPKLSREYDCPTVTIAGMGALIGSRLSLKTGYL